MHVSKVYVHKKSLRILIIEHYCNEIFICVYRCAYK